MGIVRTAITLKNAKDVAYASGGYIKDSEIRQTTVTALVDTGAWTLVINEETRKELGLQIVRADTGTFADGKENVYNVAGPLEVHWKDRSTTCEALILPDAEEALLGAIPLEAMDLTVNPRGEEVVGAHGDQIIHLVI